MRLLRFTFALAILALATTANATPVVSKTTGTFEEIKENLTNALTNRGMVVNNIAHIGDMLARTGKDLGKTDPVYLKAEAIEFCSATISRKTMEANPHNIAYCPYAIAIYVLPKEPKTVYVTYRKPTGGDTKASKASLDEVEKLLRDLVKETIAP